MFSLKHMHFLATMASYDIGQTCFLHFGTFRLLSYLSMGCKKLLKSRQSRAIFTRYLSISLLCLWLALFTCLIVLTSVCPVLTLGKTLFLPIRTFRMLSMLSMGYKKLWNPANKLCTGILYGNLQFSKHIAEFRVCFSVFRCRRNHVLGFYLRWFFQGVRARGKGTM